MTDVPAHHQLDLIGRLQVGPAGQFLLEDNLIYMAAGKELAIVDVRDPSRPEKIASVPFREKLKGLALKDGILYATEWTRALNLVDVTVPSKPDYFDCLVMIGWTLGPVLRVGDHLVVSRDREDRIVLVDAADPRRVSRVHELNLESDVEDIRFVGDTIYVANDDRGLALFTVEGGELVEKTRVLENEPFKPQKLFVGEERLVLFGYGDDDDRDLWILDRAEPSKVLLACASDISSPDDMVEVGGRAILFHSHYTCSVIEGLEKPRQVFRQFETSEDKRYLETDEKHELDEHASCMDEIRTWQLRDGLLYAAQGGELVVYRARPGSVFTAT